jgi:hypothetical protein
VGEAVDVAHDGGGQPIRGVDRGIHQVGNG